MDDPTKEQYAKQELKYELDQEEDLRNETQKQDHEDIQHASSSADNRSNDGLQVPKVEMQDREAECDWERQPGQNHRRSNNNSRTQAGQANNESTAGDWERQPGQNHRRSNNNSRTQAGPASNRSREPTIDLAVAGRDVQITGVPQDHSTHSRSQAKENRNRPLFSDTPRPGRENRPCDNCRHTEGDKARTHKLATCMGPITHQGMLAGCPWCNDRRHSLATCRYILDMDKREAVRALHDILITYRANRPPIEYKSDWRYLFSESAYTRREDWPWSKKFAQEHYRDFKQHQYLPAPRDEISAKESFNDIRSDEIAQTKPGSGGANTLRNQYQNNSKFSLPRNGLIESQLVSGVDYDRLEQIYRIAEQDKKDKKEEREAVFGYLNRSMDILGNYLNQSDSQRDSNFKNTRSYATGSERRSASPPAQPLLTYRERSPMRGHEIRRNERSTNENTRREDVYRRGQAGRGMRGGGRGRGGRQTPR